MLQPHVSPGQICPISHARPRLRRVARSATVLRRRRRHHRHQRQQRCHLILTLIIIIIITVHILQLQLLGRSSTAATRCARSPATLRSSNSRLVPVPAPRRAAALQQRPLQGRAQDLAAAATAARTLVCVSVPCHRTDRCYARLCVWRGRFTEEAAVVLPLSQPGMSKCVPAQPVVWCTVDWSAGPKCCTARARSECRHLTLTTTTMVVIIRLIHGKGNNNRDRGDTILGHLLGIIISKLRIIIARISSDARSSCTAARHSAAGGAAEGMRRRRHRHRHRGRDGRRCRRRRHRHLLRRCDVRSRRC